MVSLLSTGAAALLAAQEIQPGFSAWEPSVTFEAPAGTPKASPSDTLQTHRRDYRVEGLAFGGITFGALGAWIGSRIGTICPTVPGTDCGPDRVGNAVVLGLTGAAIGGTLGYLVGRFSAKPPPAIRPGPDSLLTSGDSPASRKRIGYNHWKGAAIGGVGGASLGTLLLLLAATSCADCESSGKDFLKVGLSGAAIGGGFGFLVGLASPKYEPIRQ